MNQMAGVITKPLESLIRSMRVVETGDFQKAKLIPMESVRTDEVGLLTQEFSVMLDKIDILIRENYEKQLLRSAFHENLYITVEEEVDMLESYIRIQSFRYEDRAEFQVEVIGDPGQYLMPRMTLQPLVENAVFYGADVMAEFCRIQITVAEEENIFFEVRDNGPGIPAEELEKVRNFTFTIDSARDEGTTVSIRVPKKTATEDALSAQGGKYV